MAETPWGELEIINGIAAQRSAPVDIPELILGIGDDCAVFQCQKGAQWLVTSDMLIEGVHFDTSVHPLYLLGRKCCAVNLSDIAAMGGEPKFALVSLGVPQNWAKKSLLSWSAGFAEMLETHSCHLIGGDTVRSADFTVSVTILGIAGGQGIIRRSGASPGDSIYVSGPLGAAAAGLELLKDHSGRVSLGESLCEPLIDQHLNPSPDVEIGKHLATSGFVSAMQDISDGLATDLAHICTSSDVGAIIDSELPHHPSLPAVSDYYATAMLDWQLSGGEDYRLVFTVKKGKDRPLADFLSRHGAANIYHIGTITDRKGIFLLDGQGTDISFSGYEHKG